MRYLRILVTTERRDIVIKTLADEDIDYAVTDEATSAGRAAAISFLLPMSAVEHVLERLRDIGVDETGITIIQKPETVISGRFSELERRYKKDQIGREELLARAREMAPALSTFLIMTALSAMIAATGLLQNSAAVIIGAMVIAPLMGPAMAAGAGIVTAESDLAYRGVRLQIQGIVLAVAVAAVFAWFVKATALVPPGLDIRSIPEVQQRLAPDFLSTVVALCAGIAAVVSLSRGVSSVLVGAMIAVALVPPAATVGLGMAWFEPSVIMGAGVLLMVNVVSINLVALLIFWLFGFRPQERLETEKAKKATVRRLAILFAMMMVLSLFLGLVTYISYETAIFQQKAKQTTADVFDEPEYSALVPLETSINLDIVKFLFLGKKPTVVVLVDRPSDSGFNDLAVAIKHRVVKATGQDVNVQVRFIEADEI